MKPYVPIQLVEIKGRRRTIAEWLNDPECPVTEVEFRLRLSAGLTIEQALTRRRNVKTHGGSGSAARFHSKHRGLTWCHDRQEWKVRIWANQKNRTLGYWRDETEAAIAYNEAAKLVGGRPKNCV